MLKESQLKVYQKYKGRTGNVFIMFREFHPNKECFQRQSDGMLHLGREVIEFENGERVIDLEPVE